MAVPEPAFWGSSRTWFVSGMPGCTDVDPHARDPGDVPDGPHTRGGAARRTRADDRAWCSAPSWLHRGNMGVGPRNGRELRHAHLRVTRFGGGHEDEHHE